jgi:DNA-binding PadR family transcriptional regulator
VATNSLDIWTIALDRVEDCIGESNAALHGSGLVAGGGIHGYALWKAYERHWGRVVQNGKFYRLLRELADAGLIRALPAGDDPRQRPYEITPAGREAFDAWLMRFEPSEPAPDDVAARAPFVLGLPGEAAEAFFAAAADVLGARWKRFEHERDRARARPGVADRDRAAQALILNRNLQHASADLAWLFEMRDADRALNGAEPARQPADRAAGRAARRR